MITLLLAALVVQAPTGSDKAQVGGVHYERLATREQTRQAILEALVPEAVTWGEWYQCSPFPFAGQGTGDLERPYGPEAELAKMRAGEAPDLNAVYIGKDGVEARWYERGQLADRKVDLHLHEGENLQDYVRAYLYTAVESPYEQTVEYQMGSDDGLRVWLNGELLLHRDVSRGLDPAAETLSFHFQEGVNDLMFEIVDGEAGWEFQITTVKPLDPRVDSELQFLLDRDFPPSRDRAHYRTFTVPVPKNVKLEVGGLAVLPDGRPAVTTRRGDVFLVEGAYDEPPLDAQLKPFADGLHEALGLAWRPAEDGLALYTVQRGELTRLVDEDGDGAADLYQTVCDDWGVSGNYHEFAFGPKFDAQGNAWVTLNVGFCGSLGKSTAPWRGWALRIAPDGSMQPWCDGLRSPNGMGMWKDGEMFYVDNQGDYVATNRLSHLKRGAYHGHPAGLRWRDEIHSASDAAPERQPASIWFPYKKMGQSAADIALDTTGGKFGPFAEQFFIGDQTLATIMRADLELVNGHYQGACFPFLEGLDCGVNRLAFAPDGSLFVGQTDRGWGSIGRKRYGLQRVVYSGELPFEIRTMSARSDGFVLHFTEDLDEATAVDPASYSLTSYTYEYHAAYGAPEADTQSHSIVRIDLLGARSVRLHLDSVRPGYVHELHAEGVRNASGEELLHSAAYYTLIEVPAPDEDAISALDPTNLPRVLFLTHSAGYVHEVVKRAAPDQLAHAEHNLIEAAAGRFEVVATQDCSEINATNLEDYSAVVFYTTGELPMAEADKDALLAWIASGGAFIGVHSASDTLYDYAPYLEMLGGTFDGHPWHESVELVVDDSAHPATSHLGERWTITDEIYQFRGFRRYPQYPLLHLSGARADLSLGKRQDGDYVNAWCKSWGRGRVFYTALGHRPELWQDAQFREHLLGGIEWAMGASDDSPPAPPGAIDLMPGDDSNQWCHEVGRECEWPVSGGVYTVQAGVGDAFTKLRFGDGLYHIELSPALHSPRDGGGSGIYLLGSYELQVPNLPSAEWFALDIEFSAPRFDAAFNKLENARLTAWLDGRLIHDDLELPGPSAGAFRQDEAPMGPLMLRDDGEPRRFRNAWVLPREH